MVCPNICSSSMCVSLPFTLTALSPQNWDARTNSETLCKPGACVTIIGSVCGCLVRRRTPLLAPDSRVQNFLQDFLQEFCHKIISLYTR